MPTKPQEEEAFLAEMDEKKKANDLVQRNSVLSEASFAGCPATQLQLCSESLGCSMSSCSSAPKPAKTLARRSGLFVKTFDEWAV